MWLLLLELYFPVNVDMIYHLTCCLCEILFRLRPYFFNYVWHIKQKTQYSKSSLDLWPALCHISLIKSQVNLSTCHKMQEMHPHTPAMFSMLNYENKRDRKRSGDSRGPVGWLSNLIMFYSLLLSAVTWCGALSSHVTADSCAHTQPVIHACCQTQHTNARWKGPYALIDIKVFFQSGLFWNVSKTDIINKCIPFNPLGIHLQTEALQQNKATVGPLMLLPLSNRLKLCSAAKKYKEYRIQCKDVLF